MHKNAQIQSTDYYWPAYTQCNGPVAFCSLASVVVCNTPRRRTSNVTQQGQHATAGQ